jgi:hypothetical protein
MQHDTFTESDIKENSESNDKYDDISPSTETENKDRPTFKACIKRMMRRQVSSDYIIGLLIRVSTVIAIIAILIAIGIGLRYTSGIIPRSEDFSQLNFDWKLRPGDYLIPLNQTFKYNVLLDGHTHSIYSDGKMNARQLIDWHVGK